MNNGAFGENFPYSNFHDLNMDWIIKIAKDFLDQYTHIQQIIEEGETAIENLTDTELSQLQEKANELEALLQAWYDEHSEDIADQLTNTLAEFNQRAEEKAAETIASIPDDYTTLSNNVMHSINQEDFIRTLATKRSDADIKTFMQDYLYNGVYDGLLHKWREDPTRLSPYSFLQFPVKVRITANSGYQVSRWISNSVLTTDSLNSSGWVNSLKYEPYVLGTLHIRRTDGTNIATSEFNTAVTFNLYEYQDYSLTELQYGANAKMTGDTFIRCSGTEILYNTILPYQIEKLLNSSFVQGVFDENLLRLREATNRLSIPFMIKSPTKFVIKAKDGYQIIRSTYENPLVSSYNSLSGWTNRITINPNTYNILNARKTDNSDILPNENPIEIVDQERFDEPIDIAIANNSPVISVGHRGYPATTPENTIPSFIAGVKHGFRYIEADVQWTSDMVPVILHDDTINRTSNGTGYIYNLTYDQVSQYDFGSWFDSSFAGTRIPTFEEYILTCKKLQANAYIEIKTANTNAGTAQIQELIDIVQKYEMIDHVVWSSYGHGYLQYIYDTLPNAKIVYLYGWVNIDTSIAYVRAKYPTASMQFINTELTTEIINKLVDAKIPISVAVYDTEDEILNMPNEIKIVLSNKLVASTVLYSYYTK